MDMRAYSDAYLEDVVENQGKLFDLVAQSFPDKDTGDFIKAYMSSKTRKVSTRRRHMSIPWMPENSGIILRRQNSTG